MIRRRWIYFIAFAFLGVLGVAHWAGNYPARVTIINASGAALPNVTLATPREQIDLGAIENGVSRTTSLRPGDLVEVRLGDKRWTSDEKLTPAQSLVLFVYPNGRIEPRSKLGTINR